ncbi:hypothetical protein V6Z12_A07G126600 [Gossypium hirsutum]
MYFLFFIFSVNSGYKKPHFVLQRLHTENTGRILHKKKVLKGKYEL